MEQLAFAEKKKYEKYDEYILENGVDDLWDAVSLVRVGNRWSDDGYVGFELICAGFTSAKIDEFLGKVATLWGCYYNAEHQELYIEGADPIRLIQAMSFVYGKIMYERYNREKSDTSGS